MRAIFHIFALTIFLILYVLVNWAFYILPWWKWLSAFPVVALFLYLNLALLMDSITCSAKYFKYLKEEEEKNGPEN